MSEVEAALGNWSLHARQALERAGYRSSAPRAAVVAAVGELGCSVTAREIADVLERLRLVQRFELGEGAARYEPVLPGGEHHHHVVCERCGEVSPFEDPALERAIERLSSRLDYAVGGHDVTLRGECPSCHASA